MEDILNNLRVKLFSINDKVPYKREMFDYCYQTLIKGNLCLIGLRQIGKTTLMEQLGLKYYIENINIDASNHEDEVLYVNLKSMFYNKSDSRGLNNYKNTLWKLFTNTQYKLILIDEIQELDDWTNFMQTVIDMNNKAKFIISSSNSLALLKETMVGRITYLNMDPLSYTEYKAIWQRAQDNITEYLRYGSFPKALYNYDIINQYQQLISGIIIDKVIMDDLNNNIDANKFKVLLANINNYIGNEIIYSDIELNTRLTRQTAKEYIALMARSKLINLINKYEDKNDKRKHKVYYEDKSMIFHFNQDRNLNNNLMGSLIENEVFMILKRKYYSNLIDLNEICYYRDSKNHEIDFVLKREKILVECKYVDDIDELKLTKELNNTIKTNPEFKEYKKIVITKNKYLLDINSWDLIPFDYLLLNKYEL